MSDICSECKVDLDEFEHVASCHDSEHYETTLQYVANQVCKNGLDYTMNNYSDFETVKDASFHELRLTYLRVSKELKDYIGSKVELKVTAG